MINSISSYNTDSTKRHKNVSFTAKPFPVELAQFFKRAILNSEIKTIDVKCHASPDEDTVNSALAVINDWLKKNGKKISVCVNYNKTKGLYARPLKKEIKKGSKPSDLTLIFDFNGKSKVPKSFMDVFEKTKSENIFGFDHHTKTKETFDGNLYIDDTAKSTCGIVFRFFEALGEKISKKSLKNLYCGMLSDYQKSGLVDIKNSKLIKLPDLDLDKNSKEVLEKIETQLSEKAKAKIYKHLDVLSHLTEKEKSFQKRLFKETKVTPKGNLAYVVLEPNDKDWLKLGMKNARTTILLRNWRLNAINNKTNDIFRPQQKEELKNLKGAIIFYRSGGAYQMSTHSKDNYAERLTNYVIKNINPDLQLYGHPTRRGGRILSLQKDEVEKFINGFLDSADKVD